MVNLADSRLPSAEELPSSDETPVDNQLQNDLPNLLLSVLASLWAERNDWYFGVDMAIYYSPEKPAIVPDGFLALGVPHDTGERGRLSYVLWFENYILPILVLEVVSEKYNGEYEDKLIDYQNLGILYYAIYNPLSGRRGKFSQRQRLEVYCLVSGQYERLSLEANPIWLPEISLGLGYERGEHIAWVREWLYWYDESGNRYLTAEERAMSAEERAMSAEERAMSAEERAMSAEERAMSAEERAMSAETLAEQERVAKQEAEQKAQRLAERLRSLGINPDEM
jgi:Uma2 family endonuclease